VPVGRHGQYVAQVMAADGRAQARIGTVDLVAGHPGGGYFGLHGARDQLSRQRGFGGETPFIVRNSGVGTALPILSP
jgi:hypothetical protein